MPVFPHNFSHGETVFYLLLTITIEDIAMALMALLLHGEKQFGEHVLILHIDSIPEMKAIGPRTLLDTVSETSIDRIQIIYDSFINIGHLIEGKWIRFLIILVIYIGNQSHTGRPSPVPNNCKAIRPIAFISGIQSI